MRADTSADLLHHAVGSTIAVMIWIPEQRPAFAQQGVIDTPGVDADGVDAHADGSKAAPDLLPDAGHVPVQAAVVEDGLVGEAVDLIQTEPATGEAAEH